MENDTDIIQIELDSEEQKKLIHDVMNLGQQLNVHPVKFFFAVVQAAQIIAESEGFELDDMLALIDEDFEAHLH